MIMENLRSGTFVKWVMIIVVATFVGTILFAWGMDIGGTRVSKTTVGEIGILPHHIPLVAQLVDDAMVRVEREGEDDLRIAVDGGFLSVTEERVSILAESAEFASEIDEAAAKEDSESDDPRVAARGRARLRALGAID